MPIGLQIARTAKELSRAFDDALAAEGGSTPTWLILLSIKSGRWGKQRELADAIGIRAATLTHHLDAMEKNGLITRARDPHNRRVQKVELTEAGDALFHRLRHAATAHDEQLRASLSDEELDTLRELLGRFSSS